MSYYPSTKTLVLAWAALMALTLGTIFTGQVSNPKSLGLGFMAALAIVTWWKSTVILRTYLNLRTVPSWADGFSVLIALILAIVVTLYALAPANS